MHILYFKLQLETHLHQGWNMFFPLPVMYKPGFNYNDISHGYQEKNIPEQGILLSNTP